MLRLEILNFFVNIPDNETAAPCCGEIVSVSIRHKLSVTYDFVNHKSSLNFLFSVS